LTLPGLEPQPLSSPARSQSLLLLLLLLFVTEGGSESQSQKQSYVTTDGQSPSLSWNKVPIWGLRPDLYYCLTVTGLLIWGALSDERTGLSFSRVTVSNSKVCCQYVQFLFYLLLNVCIYICSLKYWEVLE
jgi:hypothetical protein